MTWMLDKAFLERLDLDAYDARTIAKRVGVPLDAAMRFFDPRRQYLVRSNLDYGWVAGKNAADQPTLVFIGRPRLSAAHDQHPLNAISFDVTTGKVSTASVEVDDEDGLADSEYVLGMLADEIGFEQLEYVNVPAFKYPERWHYAVVPLPFHLHDAVVGTDAGNDDIEIARDWILEGNYVLHCGNAYFINAHGETESS